MSGGVVPIDDVIEGLYYSLNILREANKQFRTSEIAMRKEVELLKSRAGSKTVEVRLTEEVEELQVENKRLTECFTKALKRGERLEATIKMKKQTNRILYDSVKRGQIEVERLQREKDDLKLNLVVENEELRGEVRKLNEIYEVEQVQRQRDVIRKYRLAMLKLWKVIYEAHAEGSIDDDIYGEVKKKPKKSR